MADSPLTIVLGCVGDQQDSIRETLPCLMSAATLADELIVVCPEADTLVELSGFWQVEQDFPFMEYVGTDSLTGNRRRMKTSLDALYDDVHQQYQVAKEKAGFPWDKGYDRKAEEEAWRARELTEALDVAREVERCLNSPSVLPIIYDPKGLLRDQPLQKLSQETTVKKEADARLGTGLVDRLPSFEAFTSEEVVEIRQQLALHLTPFRSFVVETSQALTEVVRDEDAVRDVIEEVYVGKVRPTLDSINNEWSRSSFYRNLIRDFGHDPKSFVNAFVTFGIGELAQLPLWASIGAAAASQVVGSVAKQQTTRSALKQERLFLLHLMESALRQKG
jgi:hypothetical protein